jgi:hypothetical protein
MDDYISPTDPARVTEAEAIIERVAALKPDHEYETNGLTWAVAAFAVGLTGMVREAEAERDRLREDLARERWVRLAGDTERDRLRAVCDAVGAESIADIVAERDRLRAVLHDVLFWQRQMADLACAVDVLHVADLYRIVTAALDDPKATDG